MTTIGQASPYSERGKSSPRDRPCLERLYVCAIAMLPDCGKTAKTIWISGFHVEVLNLAQPTRGALTSRGYGIDFINNEHTCDQFVSVSKHDRRRRSAYRSPPM